MWTAAAAAKRPWRLKADGGGDVVWTGEQIGEVALAAGASTTTAASTTTTAAAAWAVAVAV
jgi:hypothetical protein